MMAVHGKWKNHIMSNEFPPCFRVITLLLVLCVSVYDVWSGSRQPKDFLINVATLYFLSTRKIFHVYAILFYRIFDYITSIRYDLLEMAECVGT